MWPIVTLNKSLCACMLVSSVVSDSLWPPWTVTHQTPLSLKFSRQEYWNGLPCPSPGDLPDPHLLWLLHCKQILYHWATREAPKRMFKKHFFSPLISKIDLLFRWEVEGQASQSFWSLSRSSPSSPDPFSHPNPHSSGWSGEFRMVPSFGSCLFLQTLVWKRISGDAPESPGLWTTLGRVWPCGAEGLEPHPHPDFGTTHQLCDLGLITTLHLSFLICKMDIITVSGEMSSIIGVTTITTLIVTGRSVGVGITCAGFEYWLCGCSKTLPPSLHLPISKLGLIDVASGLLSSSVMKLDRKVDHKL